jgi:hypothetical protein
LASLSPGRSCRPGDGSASTTAAVSRAPGGARVLAAAPRGSKKLAWGRIRAAASRERELARACRRSPRPPDPRRSSQRNSTVLRGCRDHGIPRPHGARLSRRPSTAGVGSPPPRLSLEEVVRACRYWGSAWWRSSGPGVAGMEHLSCEEETGK